MTDIKSPSICQNKDLHLYDNFFLMHKESKTLHDLKSLKNLRLNPETYFRPSNSPVIDINDCDRGCLYNDYIIPTASCLFEDGRQSFLEKNLSLEDYKNILYKNIQDRIEQIYQKHQYVTLSYSGGIDSMVLLSFIVKLGLLPRTDLRCHFNFNQNHSDCLHQNHQRFALVDDLFQSLKSRARSASWHEITSDDVIHCFNHDTVSHIKCYASASLMRKSPNEACVLGIHGNAILLHKSIFLDEMICLSEDNRKLFSYWLSTNQNYYSTGLKKYDPWGDKTGIEKKYLVLKPWSMMSKYHGRILYGPLADEIDFQNLRKIDPTTLDIETIANALVGREFIDRNDGDWLAPYITTECVHDGDNLNSIMVPMDRIDHRLLSVPENLLHDPAGLDYIFDELNNAHSNGHIPINVLVALKNLHWLGKTL